MLDGVSERAFVVLEKGIYYVERHQGGAWPWGLSPGLGFERPDERSRRLRFFDFAQAKSRIMADLGARVWNRSWRISGRS